jgi:hypothetical protein
VVQIPFFNGGIAPVLASLGMSPIGSVDSFPKEYLTVMLDGKILGKVSLSLAATLVDNVRWLKVKKLKEIPPFLEIALVMPSPGGRYPGTIFRLNS